MRSRVFLIPKMFSHWWETLERPHRLLDQHFARNLNPEKIFNSLIHDHFERYPTRLPYYTSHLQPWADMVRDDDSGWSVLKNDKNKFHVALDVTQFKPDEVTVKVVDNYVVIEGKHDEKEDDHGVVSRHFVRKYMIPEQCNIEQAASNLSSDGILTITVPRKPEAIEEAKERVINIEHTGKPAKEKEETKKAVEN